MKNEMQDIRDSSSSIHELITKLQEYWLKNGIKVTFTSYPNSFSLQVKNSHNAPDGYNRNWSDGIGPTGYPGWEGTWSGTVEVIDKSYYGTKDIYFSTIIRGIKKIKSSNFIKTGTGGGGNHFSFSGMLFLYDFKKMHDEFKSNGNHKDVIECNYNKTLSAYYDKFDNERMEKLKNNPLHKNVMQLNSEALKLTEDIHIALLSISESVMNEFNSLYSIPIELPSSMMVNDSLIAKVKNNTDFKSSIPHPNLDNISAQLNKLKEEYNEYKTDNPELFI